LHIRFTTHQPRQSKRPPPPPPPSFPSSAGSSPPARPPRWTRPDPDPGTLQPEPRLPPFSRRRPRRPRAPVTGVDWRSIRGWIRSLFVWLGSPRLLRRIDRFARQSIISAASREVSCIQFVADLLAVWWRSELIPVQFRNFFGCSNLSPMPPCWFCPWV